MKLVFDENELERIHNLSMGIFPDTLTSEDEFSITFSIRDRALAEYILFGLMRDKLPGVDIGIEVKSISVAPYRNLTDLPNKLKELREIIDTIIPDQRKE